MCLAFNTYPSNVEELLWTRTYKDVTVMLRLFLGQKQADYCQQYEIFALTVKGIFGGSDEEPSQKGNKIDYTNPVITSPVELEAFLGRLKQR